MATTSTTGITPTYEHEYLNYDRQRSSPETLQDANLPSTNEAYRTQISLSPNAGRSTSPESQVDKREGEPGRHYDKIDTYDLLDEMEGAMEDWLKWLQE